MFKSFLKTTFRHFKKKLIYSLINVLGLAASLTVCMVILLYVGHEFSYDSFHDKADNIHLLQAKIKAGSDSIDVPFMGFASGPILKNQDENITGFVRLKNPEGDVVLADPNKQAEHYLEKKFIFADSNFFEFFDFPLVKGDNKRVLSRPLNVVLTKKMAQKYFGGDDPVGKILRYNNTYSMVVSGVAEDNPSNSSIQFDFIASISSLNTMDEERNMITSSSVLEPGVFITYLRLNDAKNAARMNNVIDQVGRRSDPQMNARYFTTTLVSKHLYGNLESPLTLKYLYLFICVAALVLLLALSNYVNLSTAQSFIRAKEIGVRKVIGALKQDIARQFFLESAIYSVISFALAFVICVFLQAFYLSDLGIDIDTSFLGHPFTVISYLILFVITVVLAGFYPSIVMSSFKPVIVLYGKMWKSGKSINLRKIITVFQFVISVALITCAIVIQKQMDFLRFSDTGMNRDNVIVVPFSATMGTHYQSYKNEIASLSGVSGTATSRYPVYKGTDVLLTKAKETQHEVILPMINVDNTFIPLLNIKWKVSPRDTFFYNQKDIAVINEAAISKLNLRSNPVDETFTIGDTKITVSGVVNNFNFTSLHDKIDALCLMITSDTAEIWKFTGGVLLAKMRANTNVHSVINQIRVIHERYEPQKPFEFSFIDDTFQALYTSEERLAKMLKVFTGVALVIACLGLFGLVSFSVEQRFKEIGIRKVMGAAPHDIVLILSSEFLKMVVLAVLIGLPIAWWAMHEWLQGFAFRTTMNFWIFIVSAISVMTIALATVSIQALKAAISNPIKNLRTE